MPFVFHYVAYAFISLLVDIVIIDMILLTENTLSLFDVDKGGERLRAQNIMHKLGGSLPRSSTFHHKTCNY